MSGFPTKPEPVLPPAPPAETGESVAAYAAYAQPPGYTGNTVLPPPPPGYVYSPPPGYQFVPLHAATPAMGAYPTAAPAQHYVLTQQPQGVPPHQYYTQPYAYGPPPAAPVYRYA